MKYLSVHFLHEARAEQNPFFLKPHITSFDESGAYSTQPDLSFENASSYNHFQKTKSLDTLPVYLSPEEEVAFSSLDLIRDYGNEPELHILQVKNPFSEVSNEFAMLTDTGEVITSLTPDFTEDNAALLEDNFLDNQIYDYAYGALTDSLKENNALSLLEEESPHVLIDHMELQDATLVIQVIGKTLEIESENGGESWVVYLDHQKLAEIYVNAEDCQLKNNTLSCYDQKGKRQAIAGIILFENNRYRDLEDLTHIRWQLI